MLKIIFLAVIIWLISACSVKKYMNKGDFLLGKYKVEVTEKHEGIETSELKSFFKPKPNASIFGSRWKLHNYYKAKEKPTKFNKWMFKNFGEEPVMYDEDAADRIQIKLRKYLDNIGFFKSGVTYEVIYKKKSVELIYSVNPSTPYRIKEISYDIADSVLSTFFFEKLNKTLVKKGDIYNAYTFDNERDRINNLMRDKGYFYFNRNYVQFIVDSAFNEHEMTVVLKINNVQDGTVDSTGEYKVKDHRRYFVKGITLIPDWKPASVTTYDTVLHEIDFWNDKKNYTYTFLLDEKKRLKPSAFNSTLKIKPGQPYSASSTQKTYRSLFNFGIIRTATIKYDTIGAGSSPDGKYDYLNSTIQMQTNKVNNIQVEADGTNSSGDLGMRAAIVYSNRNIFKKAEIFSVRVNGGVEAQSVNANSDTSYTFDRGPYFNTFEFGISGNFYFPRFIFPGRLTRFNQRYTPTTNLNFGYSIQQRPYYYRYITNLGLSYVWDLNKFIKNIITPVNINYVDIHFTDSTIQKQIENDPNPRFREQYSDHLIAGLTYSFIYNNQNLNILKHFNYVRANIETSGNLLYLGNNILDDLFGYRPHTDTITGNDYYQVGGVRYAQYFRWNIDFRHYDYFLDKNQSFAFRLLFGLAIPYGNSSEVPYEKGFFAGGANGMRGWQFRTLGPGGYAGSNDYERVGDIQIEGSAEYRFTIYKFLKGAFFCDVGNIWTLPTKVLVEGEDKEEYTPGSFVWDRWYQQLAVDAGFGFRLDFQFFIFRLDGAVPLVNPAKWSTGDQIQIGDLYWSWRRLPLPMVLNFGIGYPF